MPPSAQGSLLTHMTLRPGTLHRVRDAEENEEDADCNNGGSSLRQRRNGPGGATCPELCSRHLGEVDLPSCSQEADVKAETHIRQWSPTPSVRGPHPPGHFDPKPWFVCISHMAPIYTPPLHWDSLWKILGGSPEGLSWFFPAPLHLEPCQHQSPVVPTRTLPSPPASPLPQPPWCHL